MALTIDEAVRNAMTDAAAELADGGTIQIRTGGKPASTQDAATGTLLVTVSLADPAFAAATSGAATMDTTGVSGTAVAAGEPGWFRAFDTGASALFDGLASASGGGGDLIIVPNETVIGTVCTVTSGSLSTPAS
jgi:hypothetical protein